MICYHCKKVESCPTFRTLYSMSNDFCIDNCRDYDDASNYKYKKIAENDDLMRLVYDYFIGNLEGCSEDEAKEAIISAIWSM